MFNLIGLLAEASIIMLQIFKHIWKIVPYRIRRGAWQTVFIGKGLSQDVMNVGKTWKNIAPSVLAKARLRSLKPTVCAVFAGRNDDYVKDNEARIRAVIEWNSKVLCDEVIFVEWNPLPDRPLLSLALAKDYPNVRAYIVPREIHEQICTNPRMSVMEYFAKNVGIRRARSDYICVTNADILWDKDVKRVSLFLEKSLVFRTRRVELNWDGRKPTQEYLRDRKNRVEYKFGWRQGIEYGCGDFTLAHRDLWHQARGYDESLRDSRINCDSRGLLQLMALGGRPVHFGLHYHLYHQTSSTALGNSSHGGFFEYWENLPYKNPATWGLEDCVEEQLAERVWALK